MNLTLCFHFHTNRDTLEVVNTVAQALGIEAGEYNGREWVRIEHIKRKEAQRA